MCVCVFVFIPPFYFFGGYTLSDLSARENKNTVRIYYSQKKNWREEVLFFYTVMENFLLDAHRGSTLLSLYKTKSLAKRRRGEVTGIAVTAPVAATEEQAQCCRCTTTGGEIKPPAATAAANRHYLTNLTPRSSSGGFTPSLSPPPPPSLLSLFKRPLSGGYIANDDDDDDDDTNNGCGGGGGSGGSCNETSFCATGRKTETTAVTAAAPPPPPPPVTPNDRTVNFVVGLPTRVDFSKTVSGVASPLFLVSPGSPSDRERLILAFSAADTNIQHYKNTVATIEAPHWCLFNNPPLHEHVLCRLDTAGLVNRSRFITLPVEATGELTGFKYTGGVTPQNLVFPVGAAEINWLAILRGSIRFGVVCAQACDAKIAFPDLNDTNCDTTRNFKLALKRMRIWRSLDWISEASRVAGMIRYEPFSMGCGLYDAEARKMQLKSRYERSLLYLGDHFSRESLLINDMSRGGHASDFWTIVAAIIQHKTRLKKKEKKNIGGDSDDDGDVSPSAAVCLTDSTSTRECWKRKLIINTEKAEHGQSADETKTVEAAIGAFEGVGGARKARLLDFANTVFSAEQRSVLFKASGEGSAQVATLGALADSVLASTARSGIWIMLYSLLRQIQFDILHLIGYEAHRVLIFKIFVPALMSLRCRVAAWTRSKSCAAWSRYRYRQSQH